MFNRSLLKKAGLAGLALPAALLVCGYTATASYALGMAGFDAAKHGDWDAARADFTADYQTHPDHPVAVFNMGDTYHHFGDLQQADSKFDNAVSIGKGYQPDAFLEPDSTDATIAQIACRHLHEDHQLDADCGDQIAVLTPAPAPVAEAQPAPEPAPAVEAQATAPEPPKQDRN